MNLINQNYQPRCHDHARQIKHSIAFLMLVTAIVFFAAGVYAGVRFTANEVIERVK